MLKIPHTQKQQHVLLTGLVKYETSFLLMVFGYIWYNQNVEKLQYIYIII